MRLQMRFSQASHSEDSFEPKVYPALFLNISALIWQVIKPIVMNTISNFIVSLEVLKLVQIDDLKVLKFILYQRT